MLFTTLANFFRPKRPRIVSLHVGLHGNHWIGPDYLLILHTVAKRGQESPELFVQAHLFNHLTTERGEVCLIL